MKIEIIEHCFGQDVRIDGESLFKHEYDERSDEEMSLLQDKLINELLLIKNELGISDWSSISEIITSISTKFEYDEENSSDSSCDQCSNYNHTHTYNKKCDE